MLTETKVMRVRMEDYDRLARTAAVTSLPMADLVHQMVEEWYKNAMVREGKEGPVKIRMSEKELKGGKLETNEGKS